MDRNYSACSASHKHNAVVALQVLQRKRLKVDHVSATFYAPLAPECTPCVWMYCSVCVLQYLTDGRASSLHSSLVIWEKGMQSVSSSDFLMWSRLLYILCSAKRYWCMCSFHSMLDRSHTSGGCCCTTHLAEHTHYRYTHTD